MFTRDLSPDSMVWRAGKVGYGVGAPKILSPTLAVYSYSSDCRASESHVAGRASLAQYFPLRPLHGDYTPLSERILESVA